MPQSPLLRVCCCAQKYCLRLLDLALINGQDATTHSEQQAAAKLLSMPAVISTVSSFQPECLQHIHAAMSFSLSSHDAAANQQTSDSAMALDQAAASELQPVVCLPIICKVCTSVPIWWLTEVHVSRV